MSTFLNLSKNTVSATDTSKNISTATSATKTMFEQFLLKEDSGFLLLETGSKIILEQSIPAINTWANTTKT